MATSDTAVRSALADGRATIAACLELTGIAPVVVPSLRPAFSRVDPDQVVAYLIDHPNSSGENIAKALDIDTKSLRPAVRKLIKAKRVKTEGKARGMKYMLA